MPNSEEVKAYVQNRLSLGADSLRAMTLDNDKKPLPQRSVFLVVNKYLRDFKLRRAEPRWVAIPGLRGVGKTTLLAQLFDQVNCHDQHKIYISLDDATRSLGANIDDILKAYQNILGTPFERLTKPVYIFLDEVQYDETWGATLKNLYDRTKMVFILCTGSSALSLQSNPDVARRITFTKIYPLSFPEYKMIKDGKYPIPKLGGELKSAIFESPDAKTVYDRLNALNEKVLTYWTGIPPKEIISYLRYGTLPFAVSIDNEPLIYSRINQTLNGILNRDVPQLNQFDKDTIDKLSQILYMVASYDQVSFNSIATSVQLNFKTVTAVFAALEKTDLLIRVYPFGAHETQVRKPSKYLFMSPAFRAMYYNLVGSIAPDDDYRGKLFEDVVAFYLLRVLTRNGQISITHDSAKESADFVLVNRIQKKERLVIEAGIGKKGFGQVYKTMERTQAKYGLVVSASSLSMDADEKIVKVPYKHFLLL